MNKVLFLGASLLLSITASQAKIKFKKCDDRQIDSLLRYNERAQEEGRELLQDIKLRLKSSNLSKKDTKQVQRAHRVVECSLHKLKKAKYKCSTKVKKGVVAKTMPLVNTPISLYSGFWNSSSRYKVSTLFHEATHKCGATDANYNYQKGMKPSNTSIIKWSQIASSYDYFIMRGFCVPDIDC